MIDRRILTATLLASMLGALAAFDASAQEPRSQATPTSKLIPGGSQSYARSKNATPAIEAETPITSRFCGLLTA
jgi:hypothetical protein